MTSRDFCFWLQGHFELASDQQQQSMLSIQQINSIKAHLALVFKHEIDPSMGGPDKQSLLNAIHDAAPKPPHGLSGSGQPGVMRC